MGYLRRVGRGAVALLGGFLTVAVLSIGVDVVMHATGIFAPPGEPMAGALWLLALAYRSLFGVAGGYVTARLAPDRPMVHALVLGAIGLIPSTLGAIATWDAGPGYGPRWFPLGIVASSLPCAWLGGWLYARGR
jgi:hypothetical protein